MRALLASTLPGHASIVTASQKPLKDVLQHIQHLQVSQQPDQFRPGLCNCPHILDSSATLVVASARG